MAALDHTNVQNNNLALAGGCSGLICRLKLNRQHYICIWGISISWLTLNVIIWIHCVCHLLFEGFFKNGWSVHFPAFNPEFPILRLPAEIQLVKGTLKTKKKKTGKPVHRLFWLSNSKNKVTERRVAYANPYASHLRDAALYGLCWLCSTLSIVPLAWHTSTRVLKKSAADHFHQVCIYSDMHVFMRLRQADSFETTSYQTRGPARTRCERQQNGARTAGRMLWQSGYVLD